MSESKTYGLGDEQTVYFVRFEVPGKKAGKMTSWRMTPEEAAERFAGQRYELVEKDKLTFITGDILSRGQWL